MILYCPGICFGILRETTNNFEHTLSRWSFQPGTPPPPKHTFLGALCVERGPPSLSDQLFLHYLTTHDQLRVLKAARMSENKCSENVTGHERKRQFGRSQDRWDDNIKQNFNEKP